MTVRKTRAGAPALPEEILLRIEHRGVDDLAPYEGNARKHSPKQITQIAASIRTFGSRIRC